MEQLGDGGVIDIVAVVLEPMNFNQALRDVLWLLKRRDDFLELFRLVGQHLFQLARRVANVQRHLNEQIEVLFFFGQQIQNSHRMSSLNAGISYRRRVKSFLRAYEIHLNNNRSSRPSLNQLISLVK